MTKPSETRAGEQEGTRFDEFDDDTHPFRKWWNEHGQYMLSGGGRRESIWAARGWIAREQLACGVPVTGDSLCETKAAPVQTGEGSTPEDTQLLGHTVYDSEKQTVEFRPVEGGSTRPDAPLDLDRLARDYETDERKVNWTLFNDLRGSLHSVLVGFGRRVLSAASVQGEGVAPDNELTFENLLPLFWELVDAVVGKFNPYAVPDPNDRFTEAVALCKRTVAAQAAEIADLKKTVKREIVSRKHTQDWYARHYGKLEDWARKELPEPYVHDFFCCIANGSSSVHDSDYFRVDTAEGQLILDQTRRAEEAELRSEDLASQLTAAQAQFCEAHQEVCKSCPCCEAVHADDKFRAAETLVGELRTLVEDLRDLFDTSSICIKTCKHPLCIERKQLLSRAEELLTKGTRVAGR